MSRIFSVQTLRCCCDQEKIKIEARYSSMSEKLSKLSTEHASIVVSNVACCSYVIRRRIANRSSIIL